MATPIVDITGLVRGDTEKLQVSVTRDGSAVDLTESGVVLWFTVKKRYADTDEQAVIQKTTLDNGGITTSETAGEAIISFTTEETGNLDCDPAKYHYDVQLVNSNNPKSVETVVRGSITWQQDVTRSVV